MTRHWPPDSLKQAVLGILEARGIMTIPEVAGHLSFSPYYVRAAIRVLARDGLIRPYGVRHHTSGPGRPHKLWGLAIIQARD